MSYIRSPHNPEALYIYSDGEIVFIEKGPEHIGTIPKNIFNGLIKKYINNYYEDSKYKGASIMELMTKIPDTCKFEFKMQLSYDNWSVDMWGVTWDYIALSNIRYTLPWWKVKWIRLLFGLKI